MYSQKKPCYIVPIVPATLPESAIVHVSGVYGSLIGRLKTVVVIDTSNGKGSFQFLIGRLKTRVDILFTSKMVVVSISHRLTKNRWATFV